MGEKWSESQMEGMKYTKILRRLLKRLDRYTLAEDADLEKCFTILSKAGYCLNIKTNVAHRTDIEQRIKYLEAMSVPKQIHEEMVTK